MFVVDVEGQSFPRRKSDYKGWVPQTIMASALERGAYQTEANGEARLFYTAVTRAERYLYVSGSIKLPGGKRKRKLSDYANWLAEHPAVARMNSCPICLQPKPAGESRKPTTRPVSPKSSIICSVHGTTSSANSMVSGLSARKCPGTASLIQQLHQRYLDSTPNPEQVAQVIADTFYLKHVSASQDPDQHPGPFERARTQAVAIIQDYAQEFGADFIRERQVEATFQIPAQDCTITGSIDLLLRENEQGTILDAEVIDFKTMEGGPSVDDNTDLNWTSLALQVQLYATAAEQVLDQNAKTGNVHFLKDGRRIVVPITPDALKTARGNVEWAVQGILNADFPMRPHATKCGQCDFAKLCLQRPQKFKNETVPPPLHLPGDRQQMAHAFSQFEA